MLSENKFKLSFPSKSINESFARMAVSAFCMQFDPTIEQINDIKTAVSEAVTNCVVHAYPDQIGTIYITADIKENTLIISVKDKGVGISDVKRPWSLCLLPIPKTSVQVWVLPLCRRLWIR